MQENQIADCTDPNTTLYLDEIDGVKVERPYVMTMSKEEAMFQFNQAVLSKVLLSKMLRDTIASAARAKALSELIEKAADLNPESRDSKDYIDMIAAIKEDRTKTDKRIIMSEANLVVIERIIAKIGACIKVVDPIFNTEMAEAAERARNKARSEKDRAEWEARRAKQTEVAS